MLVNVPYKDKIREIDVLAIKPTKEPHLFIVLRTWNEVTPWVVHYFNASDGGFGSGTYCWTFEEAIQAFNTRNDY